MNLSDALIWGFVATLLLSTVLAGSQALGQSRIGLPFLLGSMITADRDRAGAVGFGIHVVNGLVLALVYALAFEALGRANWWIGGLGGLLHGLVALLVVLPFLPGIHPRMASERQGPTPTRLLQPPGFLGLNYGRRTPVIGLAAHVLYGVVLGALYTPARGG
jgi:hypothetical protein